MPPGPLAVDLDEVDVIYPNGTTALTALSVHVPAGAVIGLVGRTGSGKSTIGRLLLRLLDATAGSVRIGSVDVRDVPLGQLRRRVAVVTQDVQLFHASLRDNLTLFGASIADDDHLVHVLHELGLGAWYESMPDGLDTVLGDDGAGSSAGEAQLVAFGRAFLRDPGVVILDEATSRLDPQTEARIEHAITKLLRGRTAILIAHRSSTLDRADEIVVLDRGRVVERGAEEQLTSNPRTCFAALPSTASAGALR